MTAISREIDFHVIAMLLLMLALMFFLPHLQWLLIVMAIIPQGRILTRAFLDYPKFKRPAGAYLLANEALVFFAVAVCLAGWYFSRKI